MPFPKPGAKRKHLTRTYASPSGPCREFTTVAQIDGREQVEHGTACRQPDGQSSNLATAME